MPELSFIDARIEEIGKEVDELHREVLADHTKHLRRSIAWVFLGFAVCLAVFLTATATAVLPSSLGRCVASGSCSGLVIAVVAFTGMAALWMLERFLKQRLVRQAAELIGMAYEVGKLVGTLGEGDPDV